MGNDALRGVFTQKVVNPKISPDYVIDLTVLPNVDNALSMCVSRVVKGF